jgi:hypothetical protein
MPSAKALEMKEKDFAGLWQYSSISDSGNLLVGSTSIASGFSWRKRGDSTWA